MTSEAPTPPGGRVRFAAAAVTVVVFAVLSTMVTVRLRLDPAVAPAHADDIRRYEARLAAVRTALAGVRVVGYAPLPARRTRPRDPAHAKRLYLTAYTLAPVVVAEDDRGPLVLANLDGVPAAAWELPGLVPVENFGAGVVLLRRVAR